MPQSVFDILPFENFLITENMELSFEEKTNISRSSIMGHNIMHPDGKAPGTLIDVGNKCVCVCMYVCVCVCVCGHMHKNLYQYVCVNVQKEISLLFNIFTILRTRLLSSGLPELLSNGEMNFHLSH